MRYVLIAALLTAAPIAAQTPQTPPAAQNVPSTYQLRVAGPTYFTNGDTKGDPLVMPFGKFGETITIDVISGPTLCEVKTPVRVTGGAGDGVQKSEAYVAELQKQGLTPKHVEVLKAQTYVLQAKRARLRTIDGTIGWRLAITPVREENGALVIDVTWPRPFGFSKGYWLTGLAQTPTAPSLTHRVSTHPVTLTLKPGARVLLDRTAVDVVPGAACNAIGMGLEIGIDSSRSMMVESEVWLVHRKPDGSETSEKQVLRTTAGAPSAYVFPKGMFGHDVYGNVSPATADGTMNVQLAIGRTSQGDSAVAGSQMMFIGSVSLDAPSSERGPFVTMTRVAVRTDGPAEVLSFPLAKVRVTDSTSIAKGEHEFSLRIRNKQLR